MTVTELKKALNNYPDNMEVMTKKTELLGTVAYINSVKQSTYGFFGTDVPCLLLTDEYEPYGPQGENEKQNDRIGN